MKAKEYYQKYGDRLQDPATSQEALVALLQDFAAEMQQLIVVRHIKRGTSCLALLNEMNAKGNALARMFDPPVLKKDWWMTYFDLCGKQTGKEVPNGQDCKID